MSTQLDLVLEPPDPPRQERTAALRAHHVRGHQTADEALAGEDQARRQEEAIMGFFQAFASTAATAGATPGRYTPSEVNAMFPQWPITSIRARITTLQRHGRLLKFKTERRRGPHGRQEWTWGLK